MPINYKKEASATMSESTWKKAKKQATNHGRGKDFIYVTNIYKHMMGESAKDLTLKQFLVITEMDDVSDMSYGSEDELDDSHELEDIISLDDSDGEEFDSYGDTEDEFNEDEFNEDEFNEDEFDEDEFNEDEFDEDEFDEDEDELNLDDIEIEGEFDEDPSDNSPPAGKELANRLKGMGESVRTPYNPNTPMMNELLKKWMRDE